MIRVQQALAIAATAGTTWAQQPGPRVGPEAEGTRLATSQMVRPAGRTVEFEGRPVDLVLGDGRVFAKDDRGLVVVDTPNWRVVQRLPFPKGGGSLHGIATLSGGARVLLTDADHGLYEAGSREDGKWAWLRRIDLPGPRADESSFPCGIAVSPDNATAYVCLSRNNTLAEVDLASGTVKRQLDVGVAPYAVALTDGGRRAYVSNWGGRRPVPGDRTAPSSGTAAVVDGRGIGASGTVSVIDLTAGALLTEVGVGLHPCGLALSPDGAWVAVACANSDTVAFLRTADRTVATTIDVKPDPALPFGSAPNALVFSPDGRTLYVADARNNALAVVDLSGGLAGARVTGLIPTGAYPGAVALRDGVLFTANVKGTGARAPHPGRSNWHSGWALGSLGCIPLPGQEELARLTARAKEDARVPQAIRAIEPGGSDAPPVPVPAAPGQPSVFEHVVYIIKENRTYDQVFGDMGRGNSDPSLCLFGRDVTPNHHGIADEFVLLDNFYCNGVLSTDGHAWACEGNAVGYIEKSFGGFTRNYDYADDPLGMSASGALWDHVLARGLTLRNFGEVDYPTRQEGSTYTDWLHDLENGERRLTFTQRVPLEHLRRYTCPSFPGWELSIPDVVRAGAFIREFREFKSNEQFPSLTIVYLPNDHTSGSSEGQPTPRSYLADNDLALGRVLEAITRSPFWARTCVFAVEDDPQDGFDHVDGHRSLCLVASPYTRRGAVVSEFYNQASVLHTMERMLGIAPANQAYAMAPVMSACFVGEPDLAPYTARANTAPLGELNPRKVSLWGEQLRLAQESERLTLSRPDAADEDTLNRILWHAVRGVEVPYPAAWAGAHGRGLAALGLSLSGDEDDGDEGPPKRAD